MRVLFPYNPLDENEADGPFKDEYLQLTELGIECSLFDYDALQFGGFQPKPRLNVDDVILYRGWMVDPVAYSKLTKLVSERGAEMLTSEIDFIKSHHLPGWYTSTVEYTPETIFVENEESAVLEARKVGWGKFFVKDYVKSNYNERGSIANTPEEVREIISLIKEHRGKIEGGIALRRVEALKEESEVRYFVFNGKPYSPNDVIPALVAEIATSHVVPFYSIDLAQRTDGEFRLIEIGDGQVSDKKDWNLGVFCSALAENLINNQH